MKVKIFLICILFFSQIVNALTARQIADGAVAKDNFFESISYVKNELKSITDEAEKRSLLAFLGSLQETSGLFDDVKNSYVQAAAISAKDADGFQKKSNEMLVLDAVRSALSSGDGDAALNFLNSAVRNSKNENVQALIKLYEQWAALCNAENLSDTKEPLAILKAFADIPSMKSVRNSILFTVWYIEGDENFAKKLITESPSSPETAIVTGKAQIMPSPFWYFVPHIKMADYQIVGATENKTISEEISKKSDVVEKPIKQQLGLFKEKANADNFVKKLKEKKFNAYTVEEKKASGNVYYAVLVDENKDGTMGIKLKSAGFECYPYF